MDKRTRHMYIYERNGRDYIGCRVPTADPFADCYTDEEREVDCEGCKYNLDIEQLTNRVQYLEKELEMLEDLLQENDITYQRKKWKAALNFIGEISSDDKPWVGW